MPTNQRLWHCFLVVPGTMTGVFVLAAILGRLSWSVAVWVALSAWIGAGATVGLLAWYRQAHARTVTPPREGAHLRK